MYKQIYIPVDNSDHSNAAIDIGILLARQFGSTLIGSHVYAAKMHDKRFKQMEAGLPEEYHDEDELEKQRKIHDSLITRGLQIITDSYLDIFDKRCKDTNIPVEKRSLEGKNFKVLVEDITQNKYDLVIMGAIGVGAVKDSVIGSVCERVIRRVRTADIFVVKNAQPVNGGKIVVAVDGSAQSYGGLKTAMAIGKALNKEVVAVSAFDPYFHYAMFHSIAGVLSEEAGKTFRFKEQEKLHEEVIDSGLAKIYQSHLDISKKVAEEDKMEIKTTLLDGKPFEKILQYVRKEQPWLLVVGRIGVHSDEDMDVGSNTENLLRMVPCHVLVSSRAHVPSVDAIAEYTVAWTEEATRRLDRVPVFARGMAKTAIHRYALEKGHTIISNSVVDAAIGEILPKGAMEAMKNLGRVLDEKGIDRDKMEASDETVADLVKSSAGGESVGLVSQISEIVEAKGQPAPDKKRYYLCGGCGYVAKGDEPVRCPICNATGDQFKEIDKSVFELAATREGAVEKQVAYDGVQIQWTEEARNLIKSLSTGMERRRAKAKIEKSARVLGLNTVSKEFALKVLDIEEITSPAIKEALAHSAPAEQDSQGGNGNTTSQSALSWTEEATNRLAKVPEGFMRDLTREKIEEYALTQGATIITLQVAENGLTEAKKMMEEVIARGDYKNLFTKTQDKKNPSP